jgi:very-short-patch-repair endonuclease
MLQGTSETVRRARSLRRDMSFPEVLLWRSLRTRPGGLKFRRQHPAGHMVPDFYCHAARLVVEVDGRAHDNPTAVRRDGARDRWFAARGIRVIRLTAASILADVESAVKLIVSEAGAGTPLHHASHGPPPPPGEERQGAQYA